MGIPSSNKHRNTVRPHTTAVIYQSDETCSKASVHIADLPRLSRLLHNSSHLLHQDLCGRILSIHLPICLRNLPSFGDKHPKIRAHTRVNEADIGANRGNLLKSRGVEEDGGRLFLGGDHNTIGSYKGRLMVSKRGMREMALNLPLIPKEVVPPATAARACSICTSLPEGEKVVRENLPSCQSTA